MYKMLAIQCYGLLLLCLSNIVSSKKLDQPMNFNAEATKLLKESIASGATKEWIDGWMKGWQEGFSFKKSGADRALKIMGSSSSDNIPLVVPTSHDYQSFVSRGRMNGENQKQGQLQSQASNQYKSYNNRGQRMPGQRYKFVGSFDDGRRTFGDFQNSRWNSQKGVFETFLPLTASSSNKKDYFASYNNKGQYKPSMQGDYSHTVYIYKE
ncbi:uncharacterized protein LOC111618309 [Centruroides sculpturatus]|uniref:uncharacterized protein LOC111618309 n=1 Tax=Centruroides sculpturatus TaxID=218467 RepID=UPI000C6CD81B|nr:uncharacterized protein LOC111618309 [Centruroides sculpturatus]